ncbi:NAD(P)-binding domain-containing protein [Streptomyces sp. NBC_00887]|uniref:NAD(P)-binding domain-containing protein n=1 Tax=Streptomyces sp. NBC_00887 TaxID=2975859 RepID=UPI0038666B05|nr:NAD(P)-binding domain-containing protein [Streptomyces sp. NBC_00887]WSY35146.1 NAD(P)-binding domain-containing protein [Streptomyces sp. NBC_00887]
MRIGIIGTGNTAEALGTQWGRAGHDVLFGGRSPDRTRALAGRTARARARSPRRRPSATRSCSPCRTTPWPVSSAASGPRTAPCGTGC